MVSEVQYRAIKTNSVTLACMIRHVACIDKIELEPHIIALLSLHWLIEIFQLIVNQSKTSIFTPQKWNSLFSLCILSIL